MMNHQHSRVSRAHSSRRGGFTLVEIIVVLVIITLISSIVFAAFKSIREGNKKTSCQTNMAQIYKALRLYGQDFDGQFPAYNPRGAVKGTTLDPRPEAGLGLWALYAYPTSAALDCDGRTTQLPAAESGASQSAPLASYIKSPNVFHCPYDDFDKAVVTGTGCRVPTATTTLNSSQMEMKGADGNFHLNPFYNSYQTTAIPPANDTDALNNSPYSSFRTPGSSRQLVYYTSLNAPSQINEQRRTPDTTIITWCRFHRKTDRDGLTVDKLSNSDNVLFMDGTVQFLPTKQEVGTTPVECATWQRAPQETISGLTACPG